MNWLDFFIIGVIAISTIISLFRGFTKEAISLASWVIAFWVALGFSAELAAELEGWIHSPTARLAAAFALLFVVTVILGGVVNFLVSQLVEKTGLSGTDRALGAVFGLVRGVLIVVVLTLLAGLTTLPKEHWWQQSALIGGFEDGALWLRQYIPDDLAGEIRF